MGQKINFKKAIDLCEQGIALGDSRAINCRGFMHLEGKGGPVDYESAIKLFDQAIALGLSLSIYNRAYMHENGKGGPINYDSAIRLYDQAIALEQAFAMYNRALMYAYGIGCVVNYPAAALLLRRACNKFNCNDSWSLSFYSLTLIKSVSKTLEIDYQHALAGKNPGALLKDLFIQFPNEILIFLMEDEFLTEPQKFNLLDSFSSKLLEKKQKISDISALNLLGKYFISKGDNCFYSAVSNNNLQQNNEISKLYDGIMFYLQVPKKSSAYGDACYGMAIHLFQHISKRIQNEEVAFASVAATLIEGIEAGNEDCQIFYCMMINTFLYPNEITNEEHLDWKQLRIDYEKQLSKEKIVADQIESFIAEHRLDDIDYWQKQLSVVDHVSARLSDEKKIPPEIKAIQAALNKTNDALTKLKALKNVVESSNTSFFKRFTNSSATQACYQSAKILVNKLIPKLDIYCQELNQVKGKI